MPSGAALTPVCYTTISRPRPPPPATWASTWRSFAQALDQRGVTLRTSATEYQTGHEFPSWYSRLTSVTPVSTWTAADGRDDLDQAAYAGWSPLIWTPPMNCRRPILMWRRSDGVWRVIELGDGQVSDRPASSPVDTFVAALALDAPAR